MIYIIFYISAYNISYILPRVGVILDGVWINEWIYLPFIHATWNYKQLQHDR
jgi:hypothetical protein